MAALLEVTKQKGNEHLVTGVNHYLDMLRSQEAVLRTMASCKKTAALAFLAEMPKTKKKALFDLGRPGRAVGTHLRVLEDSVNIFLWMQCPQDKTEFKNAFDDFFGAIDMQGMKLADMEAIDKKWYQAFRLVHKDFHQFITANFPKIMQWTGTSVTAEQTFK